MSPTEGASVVEKPFTLLLRLFPGQDHTRRRYDDCTTMWERVEITDCDDVGSEMLPVTGCVGKYDVLFTVGCRTEVKK